MEIDMNEFMALEVREDATDSAKELRAMALAAQARIIAEKAIAARNGSKQFQMEQRIELDKLNAKVMDGMTQEEALAFKSEFLNQLRIADEQETHDDAASYVQSQKRTQPTEAKQYKLSTKLEYAVEENEENIVPLTRKEYVFWFRAQQRKTAKATLEMCRTTYEAYKTLNESEFASFCVDIGYDDNSSTIRKFIAIGKVYPRLIDYADQLPAAWTSIYLLTQIPADDFERCIEKGFQLNRLTGGELKQLVDKTKDANNLISPFRQDKKELAYPVAKVFFTKRPDDIDFRLLQKALEEIQARLPVKFQFIGEQVKVFKERTAQRYETVKQEDELTAVHPSNWDYGSAANDVHETQPAAA
jgi:hypothetical protein